MSIAILKKCTKKLALVVMISFICLSLFFSITDKYVYAGDNTTQVQRISGADRIETALEIAAYGWNRSDKVVLARYDAFPDALSGTPLAAAYEAPVLLTRPDSLPSPVKGKIMDLEAREVIILGGEGAISENVAEEIKELDINISRIGGKDRYETSKKIADALVEARGRAAREAVVAFGHDFPDALAVGSYAADQGMPILLVDKDRIPSSTQNALNEVDRTVVVGGEAVISEQVKEKLPTPTRIAGEDRYETVSLLIKELDMALEKAFLATGMEFADALSGSALAARENGSILLVSPDKIPRPIQKVCSEIGVDNFVILGGENAVASETLSQYPVLKNVPTVDKVTGFYALGGSWTNLFERDYPEYSTGNTDVIDELALGWYSVDQKGKLLTESGTGWWKPAGWERVLERAEEFDLRTEMVVHQENRRLSNENGNENEFHLLDKLLQDQEAVEAFVKEVAEGAGDYDGVNLNLEGLGREQRGEELEELQEQFNDLVSQLSSQLEDKNKSLTLTLHPPNSIYRGYDYASLGQMADRIIIMAYDYGSSPEPINRVKEAVEMAKDKVPAKKLELGISKHSETAWSAPEKLEVATSYDLGGVALWRLGLISQEQWRVLRAYTE